MTYSAVGTQNSGRNQKRRSQSGRRLDPRLWRSGARDEKGTFYAIYGMCTVSSDS